MFLKILNLCLNVCAYINHRYESQIVMFLIVFIDSFEFFQRELIIKHKTGIGKSTFDT